MTRETCRGQMPNVSSPCHDLTLSVTALNGRAFAPKLPKCPAQVDMVGLVLFFRQSAQGHMPLEPIERPTRPWVTPKC